MKHLVWLLFLTFGLGMLGADCSDAADEDTSADSDSDSDADSDADSDSDSDSDDDGLCSEANSGLPCGDDCVYDPTSIDCDAACTHMADVCDDPDCADDCEDMYADHESCVLGCNYTTTLNCTNLVFGCYAEFTACLDIGDCIFEYF